ncbi:MAG: aminotransferase class I/II-fold pyridoxal phosphate-dependent enzyme [Saprospiraceae bacterium]|nr:aminotransferase class I/II-fold pyridoxal phosphate-dependent enzyme [Saprospiraceae bacterium]
MTMITTAKRLDGIAEYYFATKLREIAQMRREGKDVLNLGVGSPDLPPSAEFVSALKFHASQNKSHGYQSYTGIPALRQAWANWYGRFYDVKLDAEGEVLPLIGSKEGIVHIAMTFLEAGDVALVPNPGYPAYRAASLLAGAEVRFYHLQEKNCWLPDLEKLEQTDLSKVKIMWVNLPHMPTGAPPSATIFQDLVDFGIKHNILIINDNPYSFILNEKPVSILSAEGAMDAALELNSMSKSHNLAGWRVGVLAGNKHYLQSVLRFKSNMDSGQPLPLQEAAIRALQAPIDWYRSQNATYRQRQLLAFKLLQMLDCRFNENQQGMFVWAKVPANFADGFALSDQILYGANVFLTPGGIFGSEGKKYVRVSLCQEVAVFEKAMRRIERLIAENQPVRISENLHLKMATA